MVKKIQVSENSEDDENETDQKKILCRIEKNGIYLEILWTVFSDIPVNCHQEEQEEIIKGIEDGLTDQEIKRYFALYGADKMQQYRRVLTARKNRG